MKRWYWNFRKRIARWFPDPTQGIGFMTVHGEHRISSGELGLVLDVEGRTGVVYLSKPAWAALGASAGWLSNEEAEKIWNDEIIQGI